MATIRFLERFAITGGHVSIFLYLSMAEENGRKETIDVTKSTSSTIVGKCSVTVGVDLYVSRFFRLFRGRIVGRLTRLNDR